MTPAPLLVVGDALLDRDVDGRVERLAPEAPVPVLDEATVRARPGGAALAAVLAAADGHEVMLVTALGDDEAGRELADALAAAGVVLVDLGLEGPTPEKVRLRAAGRPLLRLDRGGPPSRVCPPGAQARSAIGWAETVLVADYGRGVAAAPGVRRALAAAARDGLLVWDPHPRGAAPVARAALVTPNAAEARALCPQEAAAAGDAATDARRGALLAALWNARHVVVTRGAEGAMLADATGDIRAFPAPPVAAGDPCGAGDRFASRAAGALADGADAEQAVAAAVWSASAYVAAGGAGAFSGSGPSVHAGPATRPAGDGAEHALVLAEHVRAAGGTLVATGGCFDLLHTGHVRTLEAARSLGDRLVVCLNSDESVRRLKGAGRPVVTEAERAAVLRALRCVDAVLVFAEDTPDRALARLRPHIWAKGGDYRAADLPEAATVEAAGGRVVVLPYLDGHSTTRLIEEASLHAVS